jgi:hypothetical protein
VPETCAFKNVRRSETASSVFPLRIDRGDPPDTNASCRRAIEMFALRICVCANVRVTSASRIASERSGGGSAVPAGARAP